jgi:hypothetical protein
MLVLFFAEPTRRSSVLVGAMWLFTLAALFAALGAIFGDWTLKRALLFATPAFQLWMLNIAVGIFHQLSGRDPWLVWGESYRPRQKRETAYFLSSTSVRRFLCHWQRWLSRRDVYGIFAEQAAAGDARSARA